MNFVDMMGTDGHCSVTTKIMCTLYLHVLLSIGKLLHLGVISACWIK